MKILWLSNKLLADFDARSTGTWLDAMANELIQSGEITLGNISLGKVTTTTRKDYGPVQQWVVPIRSSIGRNGLPSSVTVDEIVECVEDFSPDLVHVWGTESFWGLLTGRKIINTLALLEMQGLKSAIAKVFHGGLSVREQIACTGFKEIFKRSMIYQDRRRFEKWGEFEREIISRHHYIAVQTNWIASQVRAINRSGVLLGNDLMLREQFYDSGPWISPASRELKNFVAHSSEGLYESSRTAREPFYRAVPWHYTGGHQVFCMTAYPSPFKGLHVAIRAMATLCNRYPDLKLRIAGALQKKGLRQDGYIGWLNREIKRLGIEANVEWLGALDAAGIINEMEAASALLVPSYIENCCNTMQEAMIIGTPVVASYAGGLPSLARDEESVLFFPTGDETMCAYQLERVMSDMKLAEYLSENSRKLALTRSDRKNALKNQIEVYRQVISHDKGNN